MIPYGGPRSGVLLSTGAGPEFLHLGVYRFRRGYGGRISGRRRLTAIKRATYKLNNNNTVAVAA